MSTSELIFIPKYISKAVYDNDIHTLQSVRKCWGNSSYLSSSSHISTILWSPGYRVGVKIGLYFQYSSLKWFLYYFLIQQELLKH